MRGGYIIIIIIITGSDKYGFPLRRTDGHFTIHKKHFFPTKQFPDLEKRFSSRVSQVMQEERETGLSVRMRYVEKEEEEEEEESAECFAGRGGFLTFRRVAQ